MQENPTREVSPMPLTIDVSSSDSGSDTDSVSSSFEDSGYGSSLSLRTKRFSVPNCTEGGLLKKQKVERSSVVLPPGFLDPLPFEEKPLSAVPTVVNPRLDLISKSCKQFWKAGDYEGGDGHVSCSHSIGMDHLRVHPKFLHSNATSHRWALGAFAELLDNSLDEICNGATYVNVDVLENKKEDNKMLLVEDDGGGMAPDFLRQCMSLGYSVKSKSANTIGQYGNGFKTSTMRLGADVVVFSRCQFIGASPTQSIGMLSYTFLRNTRMDDIVVPIIDYEKRGPNWDKMIRSSSDDWDINLKTILQWSPYASEEELLQQFNVMRDQGTRIILYNLWEDDEGNVELDFDSDQHDIQLRGVSRDEKKIIMAEKYPNSRHFLTYQHSLRSYASILYLRLPPGFRIILRGKDVSHHSLVNDMMLAKEILYKPQSVPDGMPKDSNMVAVVTIGFVKDAKDHIDIQGFNVYHKNRLIKPFWRVWNAAGSGGRGVIGVLEANFVEPAHDKQGFERTTVLSRLEARLVVMQKNYWFNNSGSIGYAAGRQFKKSISPDTESPDKNKSCPDRGSLISDKDKFYSPTNKNRRPSYNDESGKKSAVKSNNISSTAETLTGDEVRTVQHCSKFSGSHSKARQCNDVQDHLTNGGSHQVTGDTHSKARRCNDVQDGSSNVRSHQVTGDSYSKAADTNGGLPASIHVACLSTLKEENRELKERLREMEKLAAADPLKDIEHERERCKMLETKLQEAEQKLKEMDTEQESLINIFSEERERRDEEERHLRKRLKDASDTIDELLDKEMRLKKAHKL